MVPGTDFCGSTGDGECADGDHNHSTGERPPHRILHRMWILQMFNGSGWSLRNLRNMVSDGAPSSSFLVVRKWRAGRAHTSHPAPFSVCSRSGVAVHSSQLSLAKP